MLIGHLRSFSDPDKSYKIYRFGKTIEDGGDGVKWECHNKDDTVCKGSYPCKHLKCVWGYEKKNALSGLVLSGWLRLTKKGENFYKRLSKRLSKKAADDLNKFKDIFKSAVLDKDFAIIKNMNDK